MRAKQAALQAKARASAGEALAACKEACTIDATASDETLQAARNRADDVLTACEVFPDVATRREQAEIRRCVDEWKRLADARSALVAARGANRQ